MSRRVLITLGLLLALAVTAAFLAPRVVLAPHNFSQHPGFDDYFKANPPATEVPSAQDRALLRKHRPHFFVSANSRRPIDFYTDYIAHGELRKADGALISDAVTPELLNEHKDDPSVVFTHVLPQRQDKALPVVFGRVDRASIDLGEGALPLTFLTYHAVFRHSGLPAGLPAWQDWLLSWIADPQDWHQLDHYTAATIVLDAHGVPFAMLLQQHNYHRTYLFGEGATLATDGRAMIDIASRSNELYPHATGRTVRRAASFIDPASWRYLIGIDNWKLMAADDVTNPISEVEFKLAFLAPSDAFYTFKGFLGARRMLPGRDGPPGADYKALPQHMAQRTQLLLGYWREGNERDRITLLRALAEKNGYTAFMKAQQGVLNANLKCLQRWKGACALQ